MARDLEQLFDKAYYAEKEREAADLLVKQVDLEKRAEEELFKLRSSNAERLAEKAIDRIQEQRALELRVQQDSYEQMLKYNVDAEKIEKLRAVNLAKYEEKQELEKLKREKKITDKEYKARKKEIAKQEKEEEKKFLKTLSKKEQLQIASAKKVAAAKARDEAASEMKGAFGKGKSLSERVNILSDGIKKGGISSLISALSDLASQLDGTVEDIAKSQSAVDTRLQGSRLATRKTSTGGDSYWAAMSTDVRKNIGSSGLVKQESVIANLKSMVGSGIAYNVEQRAFLATISDKVADTFSATQASLLKLVRIQQQDTTAARLGMESALTAFLNNMYETTEYMTDMANSVKNNIYEASALMTAKSATEFEFQIQKWLGSLYSVGFGTDLSSAIGNLAAGNISSISNGGVGNLLVMAANRANMSIADILSDGLDASETNSLMQAMVEYLGDIYSETKGSNVLAQQYASVFGLTASDLKAAANLAGSTRNIANSNVNYGGMLSRLSSMANTMYQRTSLGELASNAWSNTLYSIAGGIANNPALYALNKISTLLSDVTGGIDFGLPLVAGTGTTQTFNVADLMKVGAFGTSILGNLPLMLGGLFSSGNDLLNKFGVNSSKMVTRGTGLNIMQGSGTMTSSSGYIANGGSDISNKIMTDTTDEQTQKISAAHDENTEATTTDINDNIIKIYALLDAFANGSKTLHVETGTAASWTIDTGKTFGVF